MRLPKRTSLLLTCLPLLLFSSPGHGAPLIELTGAPDSPNPLSTFLAPGLSAAYFNPAFLPTQTSGFSMGLLGVTAQLDISLEPRDSSFDVDRSIFDSIPVSGVENMLRPLPTDLLRSRRGFRDPSSSGGYVTIGSLLAFSNFAIGFMGIFPLGSFQEQEPFFVDEREQYFSNSLHFERYEDRLRTNVVVLGGGWMPIPELSIGVGVTMSTSAVTKAFIFMPDASRQNESHMNTAVAVNTRFLPHFGLLWRPAPRWEITGALHAAGGSSTDGESSVQFWNYQPSSGDDTVVQHFRMVYGYEPLRAAVGAVFKNGRPFDRWMFGAQMRYERWSTYEDRHGEHPILPWSDTFTAAAGLRRTWAGEHTLGIDALFSPSPVPEQTGRSNYVDNARIGAAVGYERRLRRLTFGLNVQAHFLVPRTHVKDPGSKDPVFDEYPDSNHIFTNEFIPQSAGFQTNNPGFPGFSSSGWIAAVMGYMRIETN